MAESSRKSSIGIRFNSKDVTKTISGYMESFSYTDSASGEADTFSLSLNNQDGEWTDKYMPGDDDSISATIHVTDWNSSGDNRKLECGKFAVDEFSGSSSPDIITIGGISTPTTADFCKTEKNEQWSSTTLKTIISDIAHEAGLELIYDSKDYTIEEIEQSMQTDMKFAYNLCSKYNLCMKIFDKKLVVYDRLKYENKPASYDISKANTSSLNFKKSLTFLYDGVKLDYTDPETNTTISYSYTIPDSAGKMILKLNEEVESYEQAEILAKSKLYSNNMNYISVTIKIMGDPKYISAQNFNLKGVGKISGKYFIDKVTHQKNAAGAYTCSIKAHYVSKFEKESDEIKLLSLSSSRAALLEKSKEYIYYTVVKGDTLWAISAKYLGKGSRYMEIYNVNKDILKSPSLIYPGQVLKIPKEGD